MIFVIFHGAGGNPEGNWFPELKEKLEALGQKVIIPKFPTPKNQNLNNWLAVFDPIYKSFKKNKKLCFIGHSLGPVFIWHLVSRYNLRLDSAIFVSPFFHALSSDPNNTYDKLNKTFYKEDFDFKNLKRNIPVSYTLYSDNDPYVKSNYSIEFAKKINSSLLIVKGAGHMNSEVNLNKFSLVFELCKTRIDLPLYLRYLAHRRELYEVNYVKGKNEKVAYLKPEEIYDEGVFHFRNLQKQGFCTFYTKLNKFWNTQSLYYQEARKAAGRVRDFVRVFILDKQSDLKNPVLQKQIKLDMEAGIDVRLCMFKDIKTKVSEPDFGIWDNDYLCVVGSNNKDGVSEIRLSSRKKDIQEANIWKKEILRKAIKIKKFENDTKAFLKENRK